MAFGKWLDCRASINWKGKDMIHRIKMLLISWGLLRAPSNGKELIEETLAGFVDIVEKLGDGVEQVEEEIQGNALMISTLKDQNASLTYDKERAVTVRENLIKLMGDR